MNINDLLRALTAALCLVAGPTMAADYTIDIKEQHAFITFKASHLGYSYIVGSFDTFSGTFSHDADDPSVGKASVTIEVKSVNTNHAERDKHLRGDDFFNTGDYPTITFESTGYDGKQLVGNLTFMGKTQPITIDVRQVGEGKDPWGGYRSGFVGEFVIAAAQWGLPVWVGDVAVELNIEGVRNK